MKTNSQPVVSMEMRKVKAGAVNLFRRGLALALAYLMIPIGVGDVYAQQYGQGAPPPPPDQQYGQQYNQPYNQQYGQPNGPMQQGYYQPLSPDQLDQLVAPVALYPDQLLAQVLAASTYPTQVVDADRWVQSYEGYSPHQIAETANGMPWDPSVKSLTAFPWVLDNLARNLDWTTQLGDAYYNQPQDVMEAVQAMRQEAYDTGHLRSTPQEQVIYSPNYISIVPASPSVVYVPYYNPWSVYGPVVHPWYRYYAPRPPRGVYFSGITIGFGIGIAVIAFTHWGWGWGHWHPDWRRHEVYYHHDRFISRSRSVANYGHFGDFDRHYARADFRRGANGHARRDHRYQQFRNRSNRGNRPHFQRAPQYRQDFNHRRAQQLRSQRSFHRAPQNFHRQQANRNQSRQHFNGRRPQQLRNQRSFHGAPRNFHRQQANRNQGLQHFNGRRPQQLRDQRSFHRAPQNFHRQQANRNQGRQHFNGRQPQQLRNQRSFHRAPQNFNRQNSHARPRQQDRGQMNRGHQNRGRQNQRHQDHGRPANHFHGHPVHHGNGHRRR